MTGASGPLRGAHAEAVTVRGVTKRYGEVVAVGEVDLAVQEGEILALLGPSGCGKTTLLRLIAGFEHPDAGAVTISGERVAGGDVFVPPERRRVGFVFQDYALFPHLDVAHNVGFGIRDASLREQRVADVLAMVGMTGLERRFPNELSGGQQQRVALARALAPRPRIVLLDEPFSNLDADLRARVRAEVRAILRAARATAIFVTHDQDEAFDIGDRVAVLRQGRLEQLDTPEAIYREPRTRFVAGFVGQAAFLPCTVEDGRLLTELGAFPLDGAVPPGEVELMLRPEDITLGPGGNAEVVASRFEGPVYHTVVRLASGVLVMSSHPAQQRYDVGARVTVTFRPDDIVLFRGEQRAHPERRCR